MNYRGLNDNQVTLECGLSQGLLSQARSGRSDLGPKTIEKILITYQDIDRVWLLTGSGEMLRHHTDTREVVDTMSENNAQGIEIVESFPVLPEAVAIKPNTDLKEYIEENSSELEQVNPGQLLRSANMAERILRNSMYPTFVPGDIVFVQFLDEESKMNDGEIYYIKSRTRTSMIRQVKFEEGSKIRLIAQNERYADVIMPRCDIINVGTVVGMLRLTFGDQYSEMENLRRTKEDQLNRFIDMQIEMVAEIREQGKRAECERAWSKELAREILKSK